MQYLGLDVGMRRIGVAVGDDETGVAGGVSQIARRNRPADLEAVAALIADYHTEAIVVGLPVHDDGTVGDWARAVLRFGRALKKKTGLPVIFWDERYSTATAQEQLRAVGRPVAQQTDRIDQLAAAVILQSFLDHHRQK